MKPKSIIALIIAGAVALTGIIVCIVASVIASKNDVMLFPEKAVNGDLVFEQTFGDVSKLSITTSDCDIEVIGGEDRSYIEIVNFNANYYKLNVNNGILTFAQVDDFLSMFRFWENGFSFKGMRYLLRFGDDSENGRRVIIHLKENAEVKHVNLTANDGDISIRNCFFNADYSLSCKNSVKAVDVSGDSIINVKGNFKTAELEGIKDASVTVSSSGEISCSVKNSSPEKLAVSFASGNLEVNSCTLDYLSVNTDTGNVKVADVVPTEALLELKDGSLSLELSKKGPLKINATSTGGLISVDGKFSDSFNRNDKDPLSSYDIKLTGGEAAINFK